MLYRKRMTSTLLIIRKLRIAQFLDEITSTFFLVIRYKNYLKRSSVAISPFFRAKILPKKTIRAPVSPGVNKVPLGVHCPPGATPHSPRTPPSRPTLVPTITLNSPSILVFQMTPPACPYNTPPSTVVANQAGPATTPPGNFAQTSVRITVSNAASSIDNIAEFSQSDPQIIHLQEIFKVLRDLLQNTEPGVPLPIRIEHQSRSSSLPNP